MKRIFYAVCFCFVFFTLSASALEAQDLIFSPRGGGKYIYENNSEAIYRHHLSDTSNPNPTYIMTNFSQKPGKYSVFISHINHTDLTYDDGTLKEPGFAVEIDLQLRAVSDTKIRITSIGYEQIKSKGIFINGNMEKFTETWACLNAWSSYMKMPIYQLGTGKKYLPAEFKEQTISLKAGESFWLSKITPNYAETAYLQPVHMLADFEIINGSADINIAALKHNGTLGDRSHHVETAAPGHYERDKQYKGVADSLPAMDTSLSYTIDENILPGTNLPVKVYNQFNPGGRVVETWITHINPQEDIWSRGSCAESDMLPIKYYDENKLSYYGKNVPEKDKDPYWYFDTLHSDTNRFFAQYAPYTAENYIPNYKLDVKRNNIGNACNLGNYGVSLFYRLTIKNDCSQKRYINYKLETTSNNLVLVRDKNGTPLTNYVLCKGASNEKRKDTMACMEFAPHSTTTYILQVILPTNYLGGMQNTFEVASQATEVGFPIIEEDIIENRYRSTGKEYIRWQGENLFSSTDLNSWTPIPISDEAKSLFSGSWNQYDILALDDGYAVRWDEYDGAPGIYYQTHSFHNTVYRFDKNFNLIQKYAFDAMPTAMSCFGNITYITAGGKNFYSEDFKTWKPFDYPVLPVSAGSACMFVNNGTVMRSADGINFYPVSYFDKNPLYIGSTGKYFYYGSGLDIVLSPDGLYWEKVNIGEHVRSVLTPDNYLLVNEVAFNYPDFDDSISVCLNGEFLGFDAVPEIVNDRTMVPMRMIFEKLGCTVTWDDNTHTASADNGSVNLQFTAGSDTALSGGVPKPLDAPAFVSDGRTYIPLRFLSEELGFKVNWNPALRLVTVSA